jgi:hypothetical protein
MICDNCNKQFSNSYNLSKHQRTGPCSVKCESCHTTLRRKDLQEHLLNCSVILQNKIKELEMQMQFKTSEFNALRVRCSQLEVDNERYVSQITQLQTEMQKDIKELKNEVKKANLRQKPQIINNFKIENLQIVNTQEFSHFANRLTIEHILKGALGYAEYAVNYPLSNKIICTDFARRKLKYKTKKDEVKSDVNLNNLSKDLFSSINARNKELIFEYARENIDSIEDPEEKMLAYSKLMNYISLIRDGSQGIQHDLYPDFVKQVCTLSNK